MQKKTKIIYWIFTGLMTLAILPGAVFNAMNDPESVKFITALGYPEYIVCFVGVAKILGVIAILIPGYPRIKEWAYAGLIFDLIAAMYSMMRLGDSSWAMMLLFIAVVAGSYIYYHKLQKEKGVASV